MFPFFQGVVDAACPSSVLRRELALLHASLHAKTAECAALTSQVASLQVALSRRNDEYEEVVAALGQAQRVIRVFRTETDAYLDAVESSRRAIKRLEADLQVQHALNLEAKISRMSLELQMIRHRNETDEVIHGLEAQLRMAHDQVNMCERREAHAEEVEADALHARVLRYLNDAPRSSWTSTVNTDEDIMSDDDEDDDSDDEATEVLPIVVRPRSASACEPSRQRSSSMKKLLASLRHSSPSTRHQLSQAFYRRFKMTRAAKCNIHVRIFEKNGVSRWRLSHAMTPCTRAQIV
ncbi:hypothetical protein ACHHYP_05158 [Achlya hypogyna]|uniref:Uncharacterized protein n=1 Tax=Achlya hypogyna TaxID=1202772 RepID=A0A1V9YYK3_ACHHY|nr:hypothetical protein ACHHYP_05158 [Achlya hypogyna]